MQDRDLGIDNKAKAATEKAQQRQREQELKERRIVDVASLNSQHIQGWFIENPSVQRHLKETGRKINLVKRTSPRYIPPPPILFFGAMPSFELLKSRIELDHRGVVINHQLRAYFSDGPFALQSHIDTEITPEIIQQLWNHNEARSVIKAFARMSPSQIQRKITRGVK